MAYVSENQSANPVSMGAAILINGTIILAVALSPLVIKPEPPRKRVIAEAMTLQPPLVPETEKPKKLQKLPPIFIPKPEIRTQQPPISGPTVTGEEVGTAPLIGGMGGGDDGAETVRELPKPPIPIFKAAQRDTRFAQTFQPEYPVGKLRLEIEGNVTVRVLIGTDGRVRQVQVLRATDPDFARATEKQALKAWRFKPATRDGLPVEDWQTLTVRFDIN